MPNINLTQTECDLLVEYIADLIVEAPFYVEQEKVNALYKFLDQSGTTKNFEIRLNS